MQSRLGDPLEEATPRATKPEKTDCPGGAAGVWNRKSGDHIEGCDGNASTLLTL